MFLQYYLNEQGDRVYTLKKFDPMGQLSPLFSGVQRSVKHEHLFCYTDEAGVGVAWLLEPEADHPANRCSRSPGQIKQPCDVSRGERCQVLTHAESGAADGRTCGARAEDVKARGRPVGAW